ncbi:hypothetical protein [Spiroplasma endosymbiont of Labia minor]|uniref:hypothetical protein n=1 Tax=Spiroplasma endosymbiont of Labia minor TaxID=3066305 RepID=UPI0030CC7570
MKDNSKPIYSIMESTLFMGGFKVKMNGNTCGQFPTKDGAVNYLKVFLKKGKDNYKEIEYTDKNGNKEIITLF